MARRMLGGKGEGGGVNKISFRSKENKGRGQKGGNRKRGRAISKDTLAEKEEKGGGGLEKGRRE